MRLIRIPAALGGLTLLLGFPPSSAFATGELFSSQGELQVAEGPHAVALHDLDRDGNLDLVVAGFFGDAVSVLLGKGDGTFGPRLDVPVGNAPTGVFAGDLTGDGIPDLAVSNLFGNSVSVLSGVGDGSLSGIRNFPVGREPSAIASGDVNGDGMRDLAVTNSVSNTVTVLLADENAGFVPAGNLVTGNFPDAVGLGDFDEDGLSDIAVANYNSRSISTFRSLPGGGFSEGLEFPAGGYPSGLVVGDIDRDGHLDLAAANHATRVVSVHLGRGDGTFDAPLSFAAGDFLFGLAIDDFDGDGNPDVVVCDAGLNTMSVLLGNGDGSLRGPLVHAAGVGAFAVASGDLNGDGAPDVAVANRTAGTVSVFRNETMLAAEAFLRGESATVPIGPDRPFVCVQIQAKSNSFDVSDVDPATIVMRYAGTGGPGQISAVPAKASTMSDTNRDGAPEIVACFTGQDLARLFSDIQGRTVVSATVLGALVSGAKFRAPLDLTLLRAGRSDHASVAPNPFNPTSVLEVSISRPGPVRVGVYDVTGRLLWKLLDVGNAAPGRYRLPITGQPGARSLTSGVYFYRVESGNGVMGGKFVVSK